MNKFILYTNSESSSLNFINLCYEKLTSNKSLVVVLKEGIDFNIEDIGVDSLPSLKYIFLNNDVVEYEKTFNNLEESISHLKQQYLIP